MRVPVRTDVPPQWLLEGLYDEAASDRKEGFYLARVGWRNWEFFVDTPEESWRGWVGRGSRRDARYQASILSNNHGGVAWVHDVTGFPG